MISPNEADLTNEVAVVFEDGAITFAIPVGATLGDLAAIMADMGHEGSARYVRVKCSHRPVAQARRLAA